MKNKLFLVAALSASFLLTGCTRSPTNPRDPYEKFNRSMFAFNQGMDKVVMRPAARIYMMALPSTVRQGFSNAFNNAAEVAVLPNDLLQGKLQFFFHDLARILINTTFGIGGLFDVATKMGLKHHEQGYAATLAYYSPKGSQSPYLVIPFLGSSTFRGGVGILAGYYSEPISWINSYKWRYSLVGAYVLGKRTDLMDTNDIVDNAFDPYVLVRNAFLQRNDKRLAKIMREKNPKHDGSEPGKIAHHEEGADVAAINRVHEQSSHSHSTKPAASKKKEKAQHADVGMIASAAP